MTAMFSKDHLFGYTSTQVSHLKHRNPDQGDAFTKKKYMNKRMYEWMKELAKQYMHHSALYSCHVQ